MESKNSHEIYFEALLSEKRSGKKKDGSTWYGKALRGRVLPDSPFKTDLEISTMIFGEGNDYPDGLEKGDLIKMYIDKLEFKKRSINVNGEVILQ